MSKAHMDKNGKTFSLLSPDGILFEGVNLEKFARDNNLSSSSLRRVIGGKRKSHKGWRKPHI